MNNIESAPLTESMLGMFMEWNNARSSTQYTIAYVHILPKRIDGDRFAHAVEQVANATAVFKAHFIASDEGLPRWTIDPAISISVTRVTMSDAEADVRQKDFPRPFDAFEGPFARFTLVETPTTYRLFTEVFHVISDGTSIQLFFSGVEAAYNEGRTPREDRGFFAYAAQEAAANATPAYAEAREAAIARFSGRTMSIPEAPAMDGTLTLGVRYLFHDVCLPRAAIDAYCRKHQLHPNLFFMGVFARTLALYTNESEVVFWTVNHGRGKGATLKDTHGAFVKTVPVLGTLKGDSACEDYFRSFKLHQAGVYPFTHFCRELSMTPGWGVVYQEGSVEAFLTIDGTPAQVLTPMPGGASVMPVAQVFGTADTFRLAITCMPGKYEQAFIATFIERMSVIAENFITAAQLKDVALTTAEETAALMSLSYGGDMAYDTSKTVVDLFREQVAQRPDSIAVVDRETSLTYRTLDVRSNRLAHILIENGVTPGDFVAIKLPRRVTFCVAMLAVQKCGAGYVPLDPAYPVDRLAYMVQDSGTKVVIDEAFLEKVEGAKVEVEGAKVEVEEAKVEVTPACAAYMIYTSGSTGRPKGVVVSHRALMNFMRWVERDLGAGPDSRNMHLASFSFDASIPDLFAPLAFGGELHILDEDMRNDLSAVGDYCVQHGITGATMSTKMGLALVNAYPELPLNYMMIGGEKMTSFARTPVRMINGYGPTEFTVCSSFHEVDQSRSYDIPIGRPLPNTYTFIVDKLGVRVPRGMAGEIALSGVQLSEGYWHQPEKTAKVFVDGCYHTGDLGRYDEDGQLIFLGRIDFQVKLRGFRIEVGEIEHVASTYPGVGGVIVVVKTVAGVDRLVLYYEIRDVSGGISVEGLKAHLAAKLPAYMVPDCFVAMDKLPQTPGGKIDRASLPIPKSDDEPMVPPENPEEERLLVCVQEVLHNDHFGVTHDFSRLGLTSLGAMELIVKIKKAFGCKVTMRQLAEHASVRTLAPLCRVDAENSSAPPSVAEPMATAPMTENQRGLLVDWMSHPTTTQYNVPAALRFPGLDAEKLARAAEVVLAAHKAFHIHFAAQNGEMVQMYEGGRSVLHVTVEDVASEPDVAFFASQVLPFAPDAPCLVRAKVYRHAEASYLFLDVHHTLFDGLSMGVFLDELMKALDGQKPPLEMYSPLDAAQAEKAYLADATCAEDENWFARYLDGVPSTRLEESSDVNPALGVACGRCTHTLPATAIVDYCRAHGVTPSDYLLTVFTELLCRIGRSEDVLVNFVSAGRTDPAAVGSIGMFVKTLPIRGIRTAKTFEEAVRTLHLDVLDVLDHSSVSYVRLSERFGVRPDILYVYEGGIFDLPHGATLLEMPATTAKAPLALVVNPCANAFQLTFEYDATLYSEGDINRLLAMFMTLAGEALRGTGERATLPLVSEAEAAHIRQLSYGGDVEYDTTKTFLDLFRAAVLTRSFATAVVDQTSALTYGELDAQSTAVAALLVQRGVTPETFVAVKLGRVKEFVVAVLGIMKAGAAYVPIDPAYPEDRIAYMVEDSGATVIIDDAFLRAVVPGAVAAMPHVEPTSPAYMIYTSGSTGRPKGVVLSHRALRHMLAWMTHDFGLTYRSKMLEHASFSFDASVITIFPPLAVGGEVHILAEELRKDLPAMHDYVLQKGITATIMSTQIGMAFLDAYPDMPLENVMFGGEKLMPMAKTRIKIFNGYGPTEFCVSSSYEIVDQDQTGDIPIGRAVPGTWSLVVDRYGQLLPMGVAGELALEGPQIAEGYWHQPEKTAKVFVGGRYRTGDLVRYNAAGKLEYLGRLDFQVKLRGFRIEIGEIEQVAKTYPHLGTVAAEVREVGGTKHLVLYYEVAAGAAPIPDDDLKGFLAKRLTDYMVPDYYVAVEHMPITPNGKIDRRKLKSPSVAGTARTYVAPANEVERTIAACYGEILKIDKFGATDDFFDLGGTSIVAIKAVVMLQKSGLDIQYGDVFKYKTPRALAARITGETGAVATGAENGTSGFDYASYDYAAIDTLLAGTRRELYGDFRRHSLGDVLLTGATGYLGIHVLSYLLEHTDATVHVLVRSRKGAGPRRRIDSQFVYYFGRRIPKACLDRLDFIEGDITDATLTATVSAAGTISTVINCAALVKHYVADDLMDRINVGGVENLIALCASIGARLVHTSTYSVAGTIRADSYRGLDEQHLYIGQESDNDYIRTKFLAERAVLEAVATGRIRAKIMRLGNLMGREADGEFQMNVGANAFINSLKTYHALGAYPLEELVRPLEMSPIDRVAEAVCLLASTPDDMYVFHPYNHYALDMGAVVAALNARGLNVDAVSRDEFAAHVDALRNDAKRSAELQGILHYAGHLLENRKMAPVDNAWTTTVLYRLGFRWKPADDTYLANFFNMLNGIGVFE